MKHQSPVSRGADNIAELQPGDSIARATGEPEPERVAVPGGSPQGRPGDEPVIVEEAFAHVSQAEAKTLALSPAQRTAIELLTSGRTLVAAATAAGVNRMTLYRWLKGDAAFLAAFNAWQKDVLDTARGRILALSDLAVTTVAKSMSRGDAKTALKVLQSIGALDRAKPGSTDPQEIQRLQDLETMKARTAARKAESDALLDDLTTV